MYNFSVKDSLLKLQEKNYDINITNTINMLVEKFDENQIRILSQYQGLKIDNNLIRLFFIENVGFRCLNDKDNIYGKMPICKNIEKYMNDLYLESFKEYPIKFKFKLGDFVKLTNTYYLYATMCRMNNVNLDTIFKIIYIDGNDKSNEPYQIELLNNKLIDYIWVDEKSIKLSTEEEVVANKYNL
jgi:hypothetical protein